MPKMPAPGSRGRWGRRLLIKIVLALVLAIIVGFGLWVWASLGYVYSSGERTGYVQTLSNTGLLCKTWEGELATLPVAGAAPQTFDFTIRDDSLARALQLVSGKQVTLTYAQHVGVPGRCFGDTEYYIQSFRVAGAS